MSIYSHYRQASGSNKAGEIDAAEYLGYVLRFGSENLIDKAARYLRRGCRRMITDEALALGDGIRITKIQLDSTTLTS